MTVTKIPGYAAVLVALAYLFAPLVFDWVPSSEQIARAAARRSAAK